ncbi:hypothetical protein [Actinoplanes sp. TFC3]|uniref:hypothetical protein n=1 Tax=Actinoplanes sp. TFC3 TaxID=1710355 RepID=UPI00082E1BD6|nr:hypothetical protein [Actinoplanes sp. TFC3]
MTAPGAGGQPVEPAAPPSDDAPARTINDAGDELRTNAATPGRATETNENLRAARKVFKHGGIGVDGDVRVEGTVIAGDQKIYQQFHFDGARPVTTLEVSRRLVDFARDGYATGESYPKLAAAAQGKRLIIIQAPRGYGKSAAAIRVCTDAGITQFLAYEKTVLPAEITRTVKASTAHLVEEMAPAVAQALTADLLTDLESKLDSRSRVVITLSDEVTFRDPDVHQFVVKLGPHPTPVQMLTARLTYLVGTSRSKEALRRPDVQALLAEEITADSPCDRVAALAWQLHESWGPDGPDVEAARADMRHSIEREVEGWFLSLKSNSHKALAISLALLSGLPYRTVSTTSESLKKLLDGTTAVNGAQTNKFAESTTTRINAVRAVLAWAAVPSRLGAMPAQTIRFLNSDYPPKIVRLVSEEYDDARDDLLAWLRDLGGHPDEAVRIRAATGVGELAGRSFEQLLPTVIIPWARSRSEQRRELAAYALQEPGTRPELQRQVLALVDEWAASDAPWQLQATAARVYGAALGGDFPDRALDRLDQLAVTANADVGLAISYSLAELVDAEHGKGGPVLDLVVRWMNDRRRTAAGELVFLYLCTDLIYEREGPLLLSLSAIDHRVRNTLASAWFHTLNGRHFAPEARAVAGIWADVAEGDETCRRALVELLAVSAAGSTRTAKIIAVTARSWVNRSGKTFAPLTAAAVLDAVEHPPSGGRTQLSYNQ